MSVIIDENGQIHRHTNQKECSVFSVILPWILFGIAIIVAIFLYRSYIDKSNLYNNLNAKYNKSYQELQNKLDTKKAEVARYKDAYQELQNLEAENTLLEEEIERISNKVPIIIDKVEFKSVKNGTTYIYYGGRLRSGSIYYLHPKIYYHSNESGYVDINVKIYEPDGSVKRGDSSPAGYSYTTRIYCTNGENTDVLTGWGNDTGRSYPSGWYRIEFWYDDICVGSKRFYVYRY